MKYRDAIFATIALALTSVALAGVVYTDAYAHTARAEVTGVRALTLVASGDFACDPANMLSSNESGTVQQ
ncbi:MULTISPECIES: hypothetical protein [unclassified Duganella]|jgi:hypothetical protein|uniref:hypothetical protein n=1 Tax=unclassified Duganella TaxID=2636909 RepID=UPI00088F4A84|nr:MULTISPECIES: hypothetical protein [unclassified Duganella]SDF61009.1 hypothetical protein SAMN05216320_101736 [Duganella sp. OV458]SDI67699.1 hypothetical protein SAMN05428973_101679 [Duganella sp. OV510]